MEKNSKNEYFFLTTIPKAFPLDDKKCIPIGSHTLVPNKKTFQQQFEIITEGQLSFLDWNNWFAAEGSVMGMFMLVIVC